MLVGPARNRSRIEKETEERIARNDATFREANERISAFVKAQGMDEGELVFICECAEERCTQVVRMTLDDYGEVRSNPRWFLNIPGHQAHGLGVAQVVLERGGYVIVEKIGHAGEVAEQLAGSQELLPETKRVQ